MLIAFLVWTMLAAGFVCIGFHALRAEKPVGFFAGVEPPKVKDAHAFNRAVGRLWLTAALLFELLGLPLLTMQQNSPTALLLVLGTAAWAIGMMAAYFFISTKHQA